MACSRGFDDLDLRVRPKSNAGAFRVDHGSAHFMAGNASFLATQGDFLSVAHARVHPPDANLLIQKTAVVREFFSEQLRLLIALEPAIVTFRRIAQNSTERTPLQTSVTIFAAPPPVTRAVTRVAAGCGDNGALR
jgi:hypothetical protein